MNNPDRPPWERYSRAAIESTRAKEDPETGDLRNQTGLDHGALDPLGPARISAGSGDTAARHGLLALVRKLKLSQQPDAKAPEPISGRERLDIRLLPASCACCVAALTAPFLNWKYTAVLTLIMFVLAAACTWTIFRLSLVASFTDGRPRERLLGVAATLALVGACLTALLTGISLRLYDLQDSPLAQRLNTGGVVKIQLRLTSHPLPIASPFGAEQLGFEASLIGAAEGTRWIAGTVPARLIAPPTWQGLEEGSTATTFARVLPAKNGAPTQLFLKVAAGPLDVIQAPSSPGRTVRKAWKTVSGQAWGGLSSDAAGLLPGMVQGDRESLDNGLSTAMKNTGLTHLTAVSGANCTVVLASLTLLLRTLRIPRGPAMLVCLGGLVTFVGVVGPDPSVLRAALMGALGTIALVSGRPRRVSALMNVSIVLLVIGDPWLAADFAFILSVLATFGLYLMGGHCASWLSRWFPFSLAQLLAIPLVAQLFCSPVIVLLQPQLTPYAVLANVAAAPVVAFVTVLGTLGMSIAWLCPTVALPLALLSGVGSWWVALVARGISAWPGATFPWPDGWRGAVLMALVNSVVVAGLAHCSDPQKTAVTLAKIRHRIGPRFRPLMTFPFLTAACAVLLGVGIILLNPG